jgi:hypothetical protein
LICDTKAEPEELTGYEKPIRRETRERYNSDLKDIFEEFRCREAAKNQFGQYEVSPSIISADPKVHVLMRNYYNHWVRLRKADLRDIQQFPARWGENAWRIAVCLHAAKYCARAGGVSMELDTAQAAIEIMDWFSDQLIGLMHKGREEHADSECVRMRNYIKAKGGPTKCLTLRLLKKAHFSEQMVHRIVLENPDKFRFELVRRTSGGTDSPTVYAI